jgi:HNH endonuclease
MNPFISNCPYCDSRPRDSNDHIFPDFLGGTTTIRSCTQCNNTFGHTFESAVLSDLAPIMVILRSLGLAAPRYAIWKRAKVHEGVEIDIDTNLVSNISQTVIAKDEFGRFKSGSFQSEKEAKKSLRGLENAGKRARIIEQQMSPFNISDLTLNFTVGPEFRRLAMKIGIAAADLFNHRDEILDPYSRAFLVGAPVTNDTPVRLDLSSYEPLQRLRPPLSHNVFVKGNGTTGHCYAVVVFYGVLQLYVILNDKNYSGNDFAIFGYLSPVDHKTEFKNIELISLPKPPQFVSRHSIETGLKNWQHCFNDQAKVIFGDGKINLKMEYLEA